MTVQICSSSDIACDLEKLISFRRHLHAHPETGFEEFKTARHICARLDALGIDYQTGLAGTGVVATIEGTIPGDRIIGFRAELDALPMSEQNRFAHASKHPGAMHACGHDGHCSILLGLAEHLVNRRDFAGKVRLIFQPAEEGLAGGRKMVEDGLFEQFPVDEIYSIHNWPDLDKSTVGVLSDAIMASAHGLKFTIRGVGGHGAMPHLCTDQLGIACHVMSALNTFSARRICPTDSIVISMTRVEAGTALTVLPDQVSFDGAIRILSDETTRRVYDEIPQMIEGIAAAFGARADVDLKEIYPVTRNRADHARKVAHAASAAGLALQTDESGLKPSMASEDFSFMLNEKPGCYIWLGQDSKGLHHPGYDFDDTILQSGIRLLDAVLRS